MQVPASAGFQAFEIGVHWNTLTQMIAMTHPTTTLPRIIAAMRKPLVGKIRAYISKMEILMMPTVVQYTHSKDISSCQTSIYGS